MKVKIEKKTRDDLKVRDEVTGRKLDSPLNKKKISSQELDDFMLDE